MIAFIEYTCGNAVL